MESQDKTLSGKLMHVVTLTCQGNEHAKQCLDALAHFGKPDALAFGCSSYEF